MDTYLMGATSEKFEFHECIFAKIFKNFITGGCRFAFPINDHRSVFTGMFKHRQINDSFWRGGYTPDNSKIYFFHLTFLKYDGEPLMCFCCFCKYDHTTRFPVEPVNGKNSGVFFYQQIFKRRFGLGSVRHAQHSRWFIQRDEFFVFKEYFGKLHLVDSWQLAVEGLR